MKPSPFLCLVLKLLQLQPDKEIIDEYIKNEDYRFVLSRFLFDHDLRKLRKQVFLGAGISAALVPSI